MTAKALIGFALVSTLALAGCGEGAGLSFLTPQEQALVDDPSTPPEQKEEIIANAEERAKKTGEDIGGMLPPPFNYAAGGIGAILAAWYGQRWRRVIVRSLRNPKALLALPGQIIGARDSERTVEEYLAAAEDAAYREKNTDAIGLITDIRAQLRAKVQS